MGGRIDGRLRGVAWRLVAALMVTAGVALASGQAQAQTWMLHTVITPPILPDVDPNDHMAFGDAVSVGSVPWMMVGAPYADCPNPRIPGGVVADAGRVFIYKRVTGVWQYHSSFCASTPVANGRYGGAVDMSQSWAIVGAPGTPGGGTSPSGLVDLFKLDAATQQWSRQLTTLGTTNGGLGTSVAIDRGLAIAGEPGYSSAKGRIRTWRVASTVTVEGGYAPAGLVNNDRYGKGVAVQSNGCESPTCASFVDVATVLGGTKLYVAKRASGAWAASQTLSPPAAAQFGPWWSVDVGAYLIVVGMAVNTASPSVDCPVGRAARVYSRNTGGLFSLVGDACPPPVDELATFGLDVVADRGTSNFYVSSPDHYALGSSPVVPPATVSMFDGWLGVTYVESLLELNLAPAPPGPEQYNDDYGVSISEYSGYLAVGAPNRHTYFAWPGIGYVAVYASCC